MASDDSSKEVPKKVGAHALSIAFGTLCSRILGLVRDMVMAALFRREITDAWSAAFRVPNLFRRLLGEGSLSVSFIPVYVHAKLDSAERGQNLVNGFYTLLLIFLAVITGIGLISTETIMGFLLDANYGGEKRELTVHLARIMFGYIFLVTTYAYFMGILNALGSFAWAAMAPTFFNVVMILFALIPDRHFAASGDGLAWGVLIGGIVQVMVLIPVLQRRHVLPRFSTAWKNADISAVLRHVLPGLLGMGLLQFMTLINLRYASGLGEGAVSYIYWADRLLELPLSLVSVSLGSALLPTLSHLWHTNQVQRMSETANYYLRLNLFIAVPAALGLYFLAAPIIEALFMRGHFTAGDVEGTASVLRVYAFLLIAASCIRVLVPSYYAVKNAWYPAMVTVLCLVTHWILAPRFASLGGLPQLMLAALISATVCVIFLLVGYQARVGVFDFGLLLRQVGKFLLAGAVMCAVLLIYDPLIQFFGKAGGVQVVVLLLTIALGALTYGVASHVLDIDELKVFTRRGRR
jgi:putative peptidoglycan lipid II flippase